MCHCVPLCFVFLYNIVIGRLALLLLINNIVILLFIVYQCMVHRLSVCCLCLHLLSAADGREQA